MGLRIRRSGVRPVPLVHLATLLAVVALMTAACGDPGPDESRTEPSSAGTTSGTAAAVVLPPHDGLTWRIAVSPDGTTALLARSAGFFPRTRESSVVEMSRTADGGWTDPRPVPWSDGTTADIDPVYSADGATVWFSSTRPVGGAERTDVEIWSVTRDAEGTWGTPVHEAGLGSPGDDLYPSVGPDGAMYFATDASGGFDIVRSAPRAAGGWEPPVALPAPVTTASWEFNPAFTPDGSALVFTAQQRPGGLGAGDLYLSRPGAGGAWAEPVLLAGVSTSADEIHPAVSPDGRTLFFVRDGVLMSIPVSATELAG